MPHESSEDSSNQPDGPMGSPRCPLDPLEPPGPPHRPPMTLKQVSWPHWTLKITSPAFQIIRNPIKCHCWSYRTSYPSPLTPWDPKGLPLDPLGPFTNAHLTSRTYLVPVWSCLSRISTKKKCSISILQQSEPLSRGESFSRWKCKLSPSQSQTENAPWFARGRKWKQNQRTHDQAPAAAGLGHFFQLYAYSKHKAGPK